MNKTRGGWTIVLKPHTLNLCRTLINGFGFVSAKALNILPIFLNLVPRIPAAASASQVWIP